MASATPNPFALVAKAFDDRITREALVLAMFIRASTEAQHPLLPKISESQIIASCGWQLAAYLELLIEASKATKIPLEEIVLEAIDYCNSKHEQWLQKLRDTHLQASLITGEEKWLQ